MIVSSSTNTDFVKLLEGESWQLLDPYDIGTFVRLEVEGNVKKAASEIVPGVNIASDPYSKFIYGKNRF